MTENEKETVFLRRLILLDATGERSELDKSIEDIQRSQRCVQRAVWLLSLLAGVAAFVFLYGIVLVENFPHGKFTVAARIVAELGFASIVSVLVLVCLQMNYHRRMNGLRARCRQLIVKLVLTYPGDPDVLRQLADSEAPAGIGTFSDFIRSLLPCNRRNRDPDSR